MLTTVINSCSRGFVVWQRWCLGFRFIVWRRSRHAHMKWPFLPAWNTFHWLSLEPSRRRNIRSFLIHFRKKHCCVSRTTSLCSYRLTRLLAKPLSRSELTVVTTGTIFSTRCNIYISRSCYDVSVRLSVTEVHWQIIANLGFKFLSHFTAHCGRRAVSLAIPSAWKACQGL